MLVFFCFVFLFLPPVQFQMTAMLIGQGPLILVVALRGTRCCTFQLSTQHDKTNVNWQLAPATPALSQTGKNKG